MELLKTFKLSAYASMSVCFLNNTQSANGQVVYVDLDPDIIIDEPGVSEELDMDGNGIADFSFLHSSFTFYSPGHHTYRNRIDLLAKPLNYINAIAGSYHYHGTYYGGAWWYYPYALAYNSKIDVEDHWQYNYQQILALITIDSDDGDIHHTPAADWYNSNIEKTIDHYLGVRFVDSENRNHYGWIRCDVLDSGTTLIIKDYGYNYTPDNGIYAGTFVSPVSSISNNKDWQIYTFNNVLILKSEDQIKSGTRLNIYNSGGILVHTSALTTSYSTFNLTEYAQGFYVVEVKTETESIINKIVISE